MKRHAVLFCGVLLLVLAGNHAVWCTCDAGSYLIMPSYLGLCAYCPFGKFSAHARDNICTECPVGKYSSSLGATECTLCLAGTYMSYEGSVRLCDLCSTGTYSPAGASVCTECAAGTYQQDAGQSACAECGLVPGEAYRNAFTMPYVGGVSCVECLRTRYAFEYTEFNISFPSNFGAGDSTCIDFRNPYLTGVTDYETFFELLASSTYTMYTNHSYTNFENDIVFRSTKMFQWENTAQPNQYILLVSPKTIPNVYAYNGKAIITWRFMSSETFTDMRFVLTGYIFETECDLVNETHCAANILQLAHAQGLFLIDDSDYACGAYIEDNFLKFVDFTITTLPPTNLTGIPRTCKYCEHGEYVNKTGWKATAIQPPCQACSQNSCPLPQQRIPSNACSPTTQVTCSSCNTGEYLVSRNDSLCAACAAGTYRNASTPVHACHNVSDAHCDNDTPPCTQCPPGSFSGAGSSACTACPADTYVNTSGAAACTPCVRQDTGKWYTQSTGFTACLPCALAPGGEADAPALTPRPSPVVPLFNTGPSPLARAPRAKISPDQRCLAVLLDDEQIQGARWQARVLVLGARSGARSHSGYMNCAGVVFAASTSSSGGSSVYSESPRALNGDRANISKA